MSGESRPRWLGEDQRGWDHVRVHVQLLDDKRIGAHELAVYMGLARHAELESGRTFIATSRLAGYTGLSWHSVYRALKELESAGYVAREKREGRTSLFWLPKPPPLADSDRWDWDPSSTHDEPVIADVQDTSSQDADERDPLNKNQGNRKTPGAASSTPPGEDSPSPLSLSATEDALAAACRLQQAELTPSARTDLRRASKELEAVGATPGDVAARAGEYRSRWPKARLTPRALAKHWPHLVTDREGPAEVPYDAPRVREA